MADKISSYGQAGLDISQAKSRSVEKSERGAGADAKARSEAPRDSVDITDTAVNLKRIEARLANMSEVDEGKVQAMRDRIESGDYRIDPEKLAQKLRKLEQDLS